MSAREMWVVEMESGERFTITAERKSDAIDKALYWRRGQKVKKIENVAEIITAQKIKMPIGG